MLVIAYFALTVTALSSFLLYFFLKRFRDDQPVINNPAFLEFQKKYFNVYYLALLAEWFQAPYLYRLYSFYGFIDTQIAVIYVCGFASSVIFGTYAGFLVDAWGRKKLCILFTVLYSICCITKLSRDYSVLIMGRIIGGISTSLLFSAFDSWYTYEHLQTNEFPPEWIQVTFSKATSVNSIIAIAAGVIANMASDWFSFGPVAPFVLAIPFLILAGFLIKCTWNENYGKKGKILKPCCESLRLILSDRKIFITGAVQALFESVMYIFVFLWTPVLDPANPPLGIVFSCFMACIMLGGSTFEILSSRGVKITTIIPIVIYLTMFANIAASYASANHPRTTFLIFLFIELLCGIYFPAVGKLRYFTLPEGHHSGIINWFRVPLNAIAAVVLLALHDTHSPHGISSLFALCAILLCLAGLPSVFLHRLLKDIVLENEEEAIE
ncbi:molybdate-anion transporter-like [Rhopilema esculentum]|uniref:molybdate-anion transporter-like n=1 Tax=Rhopilema esculentum TaxID=499914 RepID=UPI0031D7FDFE|eukprot:gene13120-3909_t